MLLDYIKRYERNSIIASIIMIVIALMLVFEPSTFIETIIVFFAIAVFTDGVIHIWSYFVMDQELKIFSYDLLEGIIASIAGITIYFSRGAIILILPMMIGVWILIKSIIKLQISFNLQCALESRSWILFMLSALFTMFIAIALIINPFDSAMTLLSFTGIFLLVAEGLDLAESIYVLLRLKNS